MRQRTQSRTFAHLKAEQLLEVSGNTLRVLDAPALQASFRRLLGEE